MSEYKFDLSFFTAADIVEYMKINDRIKSSSAGSYALQELLEFMDGYTDTSISSLMGVEILPFIRAFNDAVVEALGL